jgi:hypothetical protein
MSTSKKPKSEPAPTTPARRTGLYSNRERQDYSSATTNVGESAARLGHTKGVPLVAYRMWFTVVGLMREKNYVDARLRSLAELCEMSVSAAQRGMQYLEDHDFVVRVSEPKKDSVWLVNPLLIWNSSHKKLRQTLGFYQHRQREQRKIKRSQMPNHEIPDTFSDKMNGDIDDYFFFGDDDAMMDNQETDSCESKSKVA